MAERKPLVLVDGIHRAMDPADTLPASNLPAVSTFGLDALAAGTIPAFAANVATIAPGTDVASEYTFAAGLTLGAASQLTVSTAGLTGQANVLLACRALTLGFAITVINGGAGAGTLFTIPASLTKPKGWWLYFDGTNFFSNGPAWLLP